MPVFKEYSGMRTEDAATFWTKVLQFCRPSDTFSSADKCFHRELEQASGSPVVSNMRERYMGPRHIHCMYSHAA